MWFPLVLLAIIVTLAHNIQNFQHLDIDITYQLQRPPKLGYTITQLTIGAIFEIYSLTETRGGVKLDFHQRNMTPLVYLRILWN